MASVELSRRVEKVVGFPPLSVMGLRHPVLGVRPEYPDDHDPGGRPGSSQNRSDCVGEAPSRNVAQIRRMGQD
jgi:hypothetical protein